MASVTQFSNFIMHLQAHKDLSLLSFNNFLKFYPLEDTQFAPSLINQFFLYCLRHKYWQQNKKALFNSVFTATNNFIKQNYLNYDLDSITHWQDNEIFYIQNPQDQLDVLDKFFRDKTAVSGFKLINTDKQRTLMLQVLGGNKLNVKIFGPYFYIKNGGLSPLIPYTDLYYSKEMELDISKPQTLEVDDNIYLHGVFVNNLWKGQIVRGYTIQKYSGLNMAKLTEFPEVFRALKKIEAHYINLETDPDYIRLRQTIEKSIELIESGAENGLEIAMKNMIRVEKIRNQLFPNDKQLKYLLSTLEITLLKRMKTPSLGSDNHGQKTLNSTEL